MNAGTRPSGWGFSPLGLTNQCASVLLWALCLVTVPLLLLVQAAMPVQAQNATATANPDLTATCGLDVILAIDESGSLQGYEETVRNGVRGLLEGLTGTGSRMALVEFNLDARTPLGSAYIELTADPAGPLAPGGDISVYLENNYLPNGYTNWDAAFGKVADINQNAGVAPLVIFFTDSAPTVYTNQFGSVVIDSSSVALDEAVLSANAVKAQGSHIFVVGVGDTSAQSNIVAIAGPDRFPEHNQPFGRSDYTLTNLAQLASALRQIAFNLCGPSVTITKYADSGSGPQPVAGQSFSGQVQITTLGQPSDSYSWLQPVNAPATQVGTSQTATTDANGTAHWQWSPGATAAPQPWSSQFVLDEANLPGYFFANASCTRKTLNPAGGFTTTTFTLNSLPATFAVGPDDVITCDVYNERLAVVVQKSASPTVVPEAGSDVTFTFRVTNNGTAPAALSSLTDSAFGDLHGQGTCIANGTIQLAVGDTYQCTATERVAGNMGTPHVNTVIATLRAPTGTTVSATATASVNFTDSQPAATISRSVAPNTLPEPGGAFTYQVALTNSSAGEPLTLTALSNSRFGNLTTTGGAITSTNCSMPQILAPAGSAAATYSCQFTATVTGLPGTYTDNLIAHATDDEGNSASFTREQVVTITNRQPDASLQVIPTPQQLSEPGGAVTFALTLINNSTVEPLTVNSLSSSLAQLAVPQSISSSCQLPQTLAPGASYLCNFQAEIQQNKGSYGVNFSATLTDDDNSTVVVQTTATVDVTDVPASLLVINQADQTTLDEPGGNVNFAVTVQNTSLIDSVVITQVVDSRYGDLAASCLPSLPATLAPGATMRCDFVGAVSGPVGSLQTNEVTATGHDDDGNPISDSDEESIAIIDAPPALEVTQVAQPANVPEPGGPVTITLTIKNISQVDAITINKVETNNVDLVTIPKGSSAAALIEISSSCSPALPATIAPNQTIECRFTKTVTGPIHRRHTSQVVISGVDDEALPVQQSSYEAIDIIDLPSSLRIIESSNPTSVPETGAQVTFNVRVKNTSAVDTVNLQTLTSSRFGDLSLRCPNQLPATLLPGASLLCTFTAFVSGDANALLEQETQATAVDDDGKSLEEGAQSAIGVTDTPSSLKITQTAQPSGVTEPGAQVTFHVTVRNTSAVDQVTINRVEDSSRGDISASCQPALPTTLAPGEQLICQFSEFVGGNAATVNQRTITVNGIDDDTVAVSDFDLLAIDVLDVAPVAALEATVSPNRILETGETVAMTVLVRNNGPEALTLTALNNTLAGDLNGLGDCLVPQTLAANGGSYRCNFTHFVAGLATAPPPNLLNARVRDDEGNESLLTDEADLFLIAVAPEVTISKDDGLLIDRFTDPADAGKASPADTLRYTITLRNAGNGIASQVVLNDIPDPNSQLVVGSVTTTKGTILLGNDTGDSTLIIFMGDLAIDERVTVTFDVLILEGTGTTLLRNQATVSYGSLTDPSGANSEGSDDPSTPFVGDPTDTRVFLPPTNLDPEEEPVIVIRSFYLPLVQK